MTLGLISLREISPQRRERGGLARQEASFLPRDDRDRLSRYLPMQKVLKIAPSKSSGV